MGSFTSNFSFLDNTNFASLAVYGREAEGLLWSYPSAALSALGECGEALTKIMYAYAFRAIPDERARWIDLLNDMRDKGKLPSQALTVLHNLRKANNAKKHSTVGVDKNGLPQVVRNGGEEITAQNVLNAYMIPLYYLLYRFVLSVHSDLDKGEQIPDFEPPTRNQSDQFAVKVPGSREKSNVPTPLDVQRKKTQDMVDRASRVTEQESRSYVERYERVTNQRPLSEQETRVIIDQQLRSLGWEVDSVEMRHSCGVRPEKGRNKAIAEWPTGMYVDGKTGFADYALFCGEQLVAFVEAKAKHKKIEDVVNGQALRYAMSVREDDMHYVPCRYGKDNEYYVPFVFAANGREYKEQYREDSGIWVRDLRNPYTAPHALRNFYSPEEFVEKLEQTSIEEANVQLQGMSDDILRDTEGLNLRDYQVDAIHAVEEAVVSGQREILLAMATGTGKTRTVLGLAYRFLKTKRFRRILFLVDRRTLGNQAFDTFKDVKLEQLQSLDEIYNIAALNKLADKETRVQVATVQSMVKRLGFANDVLEQDDEDEMLQRKIGAGAYDLIIVDEAHRGYLLDKDMTDTESIFRNQNDYMSKYRMVLEYFDAVKVALTATPALHTVQIFGMPVYEYSYRQAVLDGYLIDHNPPHSLKTVLSTNGIHFDAGEKVDIRDYNSRGVDTVCLPDELDFDVDDFNTKVVSENFNRVVLEEIARDLVPDEPNLYGKTLIFAVNDEHADMIVRILQDIFEDTVEPDAIRKITGKTNGGSQRDIDDVIKRFKNEQYPSIAVTVDLLTTGVDVPSITNLVFMRRVKSRILYSQMLGRATRPCPEIRKSVFEIYDPVGMYEVLEDVSDMKPVTVNPASSFVQLVEQIEKSGDVAEQKLFVEQIIAKIHRRKRNVSREDTERISVMLGEGMVNLDDVVDFLKQACRREAQGGFVDSDVAEVIEWVKGNGDFFKFLDSLPVASQPTKAVISRHDDELVSHDRIYGNGSPVEDYLRDFTEFVINHRNDIAAMDIVCTRPRDLTRSDLKELKVQLEMHGFTEKDLSQAYSEQTNVQIAADIISLVRRASIGSPLVGHDERINRAVKRLLDSHNFTKQQEAFIGKIQAYLLKESVLSVKTFDENETFRRQGGLKRVDKIFEGNIVGIVDELNSHLYSDDLGEKVA